MRFVLAQALLCCAPAFAGNVVIVDGPASGTYSNLQSAIDAAVDGDVLLLGPGGHSSFVIDGKGIALFAAPGADVPVLAPSIVRNVPAGRSVIISNIRSGSGNLGVDALQITNNAGHVRVQGGSWTGIGYPLSTSCCGFEGGDGIDIQNSAHVTIAACTLTGGRGRKITVSLADGGPGGAGLRIVNSTVAVCDTQSTGGDGGQGNWGGAGGSGLLGNAATVWASACTFVGRNGGDARGGFVAGDGGPGGSGFLAPSSNVRVLDNHYVRGDGGQSFGAGYNGGPGAAFYAPGAHVYADVARTLSGAAIGSDGAPVSLTLAGRAFDATYLRVQRRAGWSYGSIAIGPWLVPAAPLADIPLLGIVPASDVLAASYTPREVGPNRCARVDYLQVVAIDALGTKLLSSPWHVLAFDDAAGADCNGNRVPDSLDIACGTSVDLDHDGQPDECP